MPESLRDAMLFVSGRIDASLYGPTSNPYRLSEDDQKRLFSGPLDGTGLCSDLHQSHHHEAASVSGDIQSTRPQNSEYRFVDVTTTPAQSLTSLMILLSQVRRITGSSPVDYEKRSHD